jgi:hypothetical protein
VRENLGPIGVPEHLPVPEDPGALGQIPLEEAERGILDRGDVRSHVHWKLYVGVRSLLR